jgi:hypothetical protein
MTISHTYSLGFEHFDFRENRHVFQFAGGLGADFVPKGSDFKDAKESADDKIENLDDTMDALKDATRESGIFLKTDAEDVRSGDALAFAGLKRAVLDFKRFGSEYITPEQYELIQETNGTMSPKDRINLGVRKGKLIVLGGSAKEMEDLLLNLKKLENSRSWDDPTIIYKRDIYDAIEFYIANVSSETESVANSTFSNERDLQEFKDNNSEFVRNYPTEYLQVVVSSIRSNPSLIQRLEPGREDSGLVNDYEFQEILNRLVVEEGNLAIIDSLSNEWKEYHIHWYHTLVRDAAGVNPAVLSHIKDEYEKYWMDDDYKTKALPGSYTTSVSVSPSLLSDPSAIVYKDVFDATFSEADKKPKSREAIPVAIYDVSEGWIEDNVDNKNAFHSQFVVEATKEDSDVLAGIMENKHLLENYEVDGESTRKQGWAYTVLEIAEKNPSALKNLTPDMRKALKFETLPEIYELVKDAVEGNHEVELALSDEDVMRELLERSDTEYVLQMNPGLLGEIPEDVLRDPRNAERVKDLIVRNPSLLAHVPAWQTDKDIAGNLVQRNAGVYAHLDSSLQEDNEILTVAVQAEEEGKGNFHWESVPEDHHEAIADRMSGGDPEAKRFILFMLDPLGYEAPKEPMFNVLKSIPNSMRTEENMKKLFENHSRNTAFFRDSLKIDAGLAEYCIPEVTGLSWEENMKLLYEEKSNIGKIDFTKLPLDGLKALEGTIEPAERKFLWSTKRVPNALLADYLVDKGEKVDENLLREIKEGNRLSNLLEDEETLKKLGDETLLLQDFVRVQFDLIDDVPNSVIEVRFARELLEDKDPTKGTDRPAVKAVLSSAPGKVKAKLLRENRMYGKILYATGI